MGKIRIILNNKEFAANDLPEDNVVLFLGRHSECDIVLPGNGISRKHAKLVSANGQLFIEDLNSTAGTMLNGTKIQEMMPFNHDDIVRIADYELTLVDREGQESPPIPPPPIH